MSRRTWSFIAAPLFLSARPWGTHAAERYPLVDGEVRARRTPAPHDAGIGGIDRTLVRVSGTGPVSGRRSIFGRIAHRSEEHTSELQSLMRISYAVFCLKK